MTDLQLLYQEIDQLTSDELKQLYQYIVETRASLLSQPDIASTAPRVLGLFEQVGETWMSDDFNAELPDSFWLGDQAQSN